LLLDIAPHLPEYENRTRFWAENWAQATEEVGVIVFPTNDETAEVMQPSEEPFDLPAAAVAAQFASILSFSFSVGPVGSDQFDALLLQSRIQSIGVVGSVTDHPLWFGGGKALCDGRLDQPGFMRRSACNPGRDSKTMAVCNCHDLGPFAAACWTNSSAPFFAPAKVASMKLSAKSNCPRASKSSHRAHKIPSSTPAPCHCWKRR
jgi:hypothetical protein